MSEQNRQSTASGTFVRSRWPRRLIVSSIVLVALVGSLTGGAKLFLRSQQFKTMLAERLQTALKGRLRIGEVEVGVNSTSIHDVVLAEQSSDASWAKIDRVEAKVPLLSLLGGTPKGESIGMQKVAVTLHFDRDNHLTTEIPQTTDPLPPLPPIEIAEGSLSLLQDGREPFQLSNLRGKAITKDGKMRFEGLVEDPVWGKWNVAIDYDPEKQTKELRLQTAGVTVTQAMLTGLPFVSPGVWTHVECSGETTADISLRLPAQKAKLQYRIELVPRHTAVHISSVELDAKEAGGTVIIDNGLVSLKNVRGDAANGHISTDATLDFRQPEYVHHFAVGVQALELQLLPPRWKIPTTLRGLLSGNADLTVRVDGGKVETRGNGEGVIERARMAMLPLPGSIRIKLIADATGFHFIPLLPDDPNSKPR